MLVTIEQAMAHLRVTNTDEADDIQLKLDSAEQIAVDFLNCRVFTDENARDTALAEIPATFATARAAYDAAILAADATENAMEKAFLVSLAEQAFTRAKTNARMTRDAIMVNNSIKAAVLIILGHLYENREEAVVGTIVQALPMGAHALLQPHRAGMGV